MNTTGMLAVFRVGKDGRTDLVADRADDQAVHRPGDQSLDDRDLLALITVRLVREQIDAERAGRARRRSPGSRFQYGLEINGHDEADRRLGWPVSRAARGEGCRRGLRSRPGRGRLGHGGTASQAVAMAASRPDADGTSHLDPRMSVPPPFTTHRPGTVAWSADLAAWLAYSVYTTAGGVKGGLTGGGSADDHSARLSSRPCS